MKLVYASLCTLSVVNATSHRIKGNNLLLRRTLAVWPAQRAPVSEAYLWLRGHAKEMWSITNTGIIVQENFAQLLLLEITEDASLANVICSLRLTNFFRGTYTSIRHDIMLIFLARRTSLDYRHLSR